MENTDTTDTTDGSGTKVHRVIVSNSRGRSVNAICGVRAGRPAPAGTAVTCGSCGADR